MEDTVQGLQQMSNIKHKKNVIQYPRFTKLITTDLMEKYKSIPKRLEEDYQTIKDDNPLRKRKGKQAVKESSSPKKSLKIKIRQLKPTSTTHLPPSDDQERDDLIEATQLSLALDKTAKVYKEQQNVAAVENDDDFSDSLKLGSYKENPSKNDNDDEKKDGKKDDDDNDDDDNHDDHALIRTRVTGSSEIRTEKMQTPIPSPLRSPRTDLSSDRANNQELTVFVTSTPTVSSQDRPKPISRRYTHIP
ncbi:hypothetical protein Tco_1298565 [Tanacetum coccineum]